MAMAGVAPTLPTHEIERICIASLGPVRSALSPHFEVFST